MQTRGTVEGLYIPFLSNTFYKIEINQMKKKNSSLTQLIMKCHLPHFPSFLHIIKSNNVTFNAFIISISRTSASQTSVVILEMLKMIIMMIVTMTAGCFFSVRAIVFKILVRTMLLVKADLLRKVIGVFVPLDLRV